MLPPKENVPGGRDQERLRKLELRVLLMIITMLIQSFAVLGFVLGDIQIGESIIKIAEQFKQSLPPDVKQHPLLPLNCRI